MTIKNAIRVAVAARKGASETMRPYPPAHKMSELEVQRLQDDRDYLERQLDEERARRERADEARYHEQKQARKERINAMLPSNRLYNGDVSDFLSAMEAVEAEYLQEANAIEGEKLEGCDTAEFRSVAALAQTAAGIYRTHLQEMHAVVATQLRATGSEDMARFADALESGDYSGLAL